MSVFNKVPDYLGLKDPTKLLKLVPNPPDTRPVMDFWELLTEDGRQKLKDILDAAMVRMEEEIELEF
jgi:hypothetical protein